MMKTFHPTVFDERRNLAGSSIGSILDTTTSYQSNSAAEILEKPIEAKPSPLDFDAFIPWACIQWQSPQTVVVQRLKQEEYKRTPTTTKSKPSRGLKVKHSGQESVVTIIKPSVEIKETSATSILENNEHELIIKAYYDTRGRLVEIAIVGSRIIIQRKVIQAIRLCVPFHLLLTKLTIRIGGLNAAVLYEINKLLPHSNITDICFDDSFICEGNYYILLEQTTHLRYLSLKRCKINDLICKELATRLYSGSPGSKTLVMLDLGSNFISDTGARAIGNVLRKNRRLLYINLSGNTITDIGVEGLMRHLQEFPLTADEVMEIRHKKMEYLEQKLSVYKTYLKDSTSQRQKAKQISVVSKSRLARRNKNDIPPVPVTEYAQNMANAIVGDFDCIFNTHNLVQRDGHTYCIGNLMLCYINLSYNNLEFPSITRILSILRYQNDLMKKSPDTGLLKIELEGNNIASASTELNNIDVCLRKAITDQLPEPSFVLRRCPNRYPSSLSNN